MSTPVYIKNIKRIVACCALLFIALPYGRAEHGADGGTWGEPMMLYFRFNKTLVDGGYMNNHATLLHLDRLFTDRSLCERIDSIHIFSFSSPEGAHTYNARLARQRADAVKGYLVWKYPHIDQYRIHPYPQGENWQELRRLIVTDSKLPNKEEVLQVIDHHKDPERCKALLKRLNGGIPYRYIYTHLLHRLRNAAVCTVWLRPNEQPAAMAHTTVEKPILAHGNKEADSSLLQSISDTLYNKVQEETFTPREAVANEKPMLDSKPLFALKTNLLFDAALMPNVEVELPIGKRWSVNAELLFPWWLFDGDKYALQVLMGGLEGRYWLGSREMRQKRAALTGHFFGLYAGGGKYDLQWDRNGYQGEFFIAAGISYGYAHPIARNLRLEYSIGFGLLRTNYRHYHARNNYQTLLWQENGRYTWMGPTKAKISLVWLLNCKAKKGGVR